MPDVVRSSSAQIGAARLVTTLNVNGMEPDARTAVYALLGHALVHIRAVAVVPEQPREVATVKELANLMHVVPHQLLALLDSSVRQPNDPDSEIEVLKRIVHYAKLNPRLASWVRNRLEDQGFDFDALANS